MNTNTGTWDGITWDGTTWDGSVAAVAVGRTELAATGRPRGIDPQRSTAAATTGRAARFASTGSAWGVDPRRSTGKGH